MGLRLHYAWLLLQHVLGAPFRYFERRTQDRRAHELALLAAQADAQAKLLNAITAANTEMVRQLAEPLTKNAQVLTTWLEGFKTTTIPAAHVVTEGQELNWEVEEAQAVLEKRKAEDRELFGAAWSVNDGRMPPPISPDYLLPL